MTKPGNVRNLEGCRRFGCIDRFTGSWWQVRYHGIGVRSKIFIRHHLYIYIYIYGVDIILFGSTGNIS